MAELCDRDALELRALIGAGEVSPVEVLESCIARIEALNPVLNAVVATCYERARAEAKAAEKAVRSGATLAPLHGLPVGIKDLNETAGLRTTYGSLLYKTFVPAHDERLVARLRGAGAIVVGKTNTPEFGTGSNTDNKVYGPTRNPFDPERTPGGSSGGSAAALAAGMLPLCQGSDTGGSLRAPATWCGVVAIRPSPGVVPFERRTQPLTFFQVQGPMARTVADTAFFLSAMAGPDGADPMAFPAEARAFAEPADVDLGSLRVAVSADLGCAPVDDGIRAVFGERIGKIRSAFARCEERDPDMANARDIFWVLRCVHFLAAHRERCEKHADMLSPNIVANVEAGLKMSAADAAWAFREHGNLYRAFEDFFADLDVLICPGNAIPPFTVADGIPKEINGRPMATYMDASLVRSALTLTGHPIVALPCGLDHTGTPFGFQIVGPRHGDAFVLAVARALERRLAADPDLARPLPNLEALTP